MKKKIIISAAVIGFVGLGGYLLASRMSKSAQGQQPQGFAPPVTVSKPVIEDVPDSYEFTGTTEAVESVDLRARITGFVQAVEFVDGSEVKKGELLFTIEPEAFQAARDQAFAQLKASEAELERAKLDLERMQKAILTNAVSKQDLTSAMAAHSKAEAAVMADKAMLTKAELNLSYTRVCSPIDGRVSRNMVDVGDLVTEGTVLTRVVKVDPMYVYFNPSESMVQAFFLSRLAGGTRPFEPLNFKVGMSHEQGFPHEGIINYMDNRVDQSTGTISIRGEIANPDRIILPGMFVRILVDAGTKADAVLVEDEAVCSDIGGKYLLVLGEKNVLEQRFIELGKRTGTRRIVKSGLNGDETYVLKGFHFARPGMPVTPVEGQPQIASEEK